MGPSQKGILKRNAMLRNCSLIHKFIMSKNTLTTILIIIAIGFCTPVCAQSDIPIGQWRTHTSYQEINYLAQSNELIFAGNPYGFFYIDKATGSIKKYSRIDGLYEGKISTLNYDQAGEMLYIGYENGAIDLLDDDLERILDIQGSPSLPSKAIHNFYFNADQAIVSAAFGIAIIDPKRAELREAWLNLGEQGSTLAVYNCLLFNDSIFAATEEGIMAGRWEESQNLGDFNNWVRHNAEPIDDLPIKHLQVIDEKLIVGVDGLGIVSYNSGNWNVVYEIDEPILDLKTNQNNIYICTKSGIILINKNFEQISITSDPLITQPNQIIKIREEIWVGDQNNGLVRNGIFLTEQVINLPNDTESIYPNGPYTQPIIDIAITDNQQLFAIFGQEAGSAVSTFEEGIWSNEARQYGDFTLPEQLDQITQIVTGPPNNLAIATAENGLFIKDLQGNYTHYTQNNSPLIAMDETITIDAINSNELGIWLWQHEFNQLHLLQGGQWANFTVTPPEGTHFSKFYSNENGDIWFVNDQGMGGRIWVYNLEQGTHRWLGTGEGSGNLPSNIVTTIKKDLDGQVWIGTTNGIAYFVYDQVIGNPIDAFIPIIDGLPVLKNEQINDIQVDGGDRKWIGTHNGLWLFEPNSEALVHHFTPQNSPLSTSEVIDLEINGKSGELFVATTHNLISLRTSATMPTPVSETQSIKVFPNPVPKDYGGEIGLYGLADNSVIKITSKSGELLFETQSIGGSASWDGRDFTGQFLIPGIYLIYATTPSNATKLVAKIAFIE